MMKLKIESLSSFLLAVQWEMNKYKYNCVGLLLSSRNNIALIHCEIQIMSFYYEADWNVTNQSIMCQTDHNQYILIDS